MRGGRNELKGWKRKRESCGFEDKSVELAEVFRVEESVAAGRTNRSGAGQVAAALTTQHH